MRSLEFSRNLSIGQYVEGNSAIHRLRPGTKMAILLALCLPAMASPTPIGALFPLVAVFCLAAASGVGAGFIFRGFKPVVPFFIFIAALQLFLSWPGDSSPALNLGPFSFTLKECWLAFSFVARSASMMAAIGLFTSLCPETDAARAIEEGLAPLAALHIPVHYISIAVATSLRFVPILAGELESIVKAQSSRGAGFGSRGNPISRVRAYIPLFVPLVIRALERAEILAEAMESRGYTGQAQAGRPPIDDPSSGDIVAIVASVAFSALTMILDALIFNARIRPF